MYRPPAVRAGVEAVIRALQHRKRYVAGIGIGGAGTYLIVLYAFRMAEKAPFVVTLRQSSIVFATLPVKWCWVSSHTTELPAWHSSLWGWRGSVCRWIK